MSQVQITFPDGSVKPFAAGVTGMQIAESISPRLAKEAVAAKVGGVVRDLSHPVTTDAPIELLTFDHGRTPIAKHNRQDTAGHGYHEHHGPQRQDGLKRNSGGDHTQRIGPGLA